MKVFIGQDELYPFYYSYESDSDRATEIDPDTLARWEHVMNEFHKVQDEMAGWPV